MTGAVQIIITSQVPAQSSRPYAEYYTGFEEKHTDNENHDVAEQHETEDSSVGNKDSSLQEEQQIETDGDCTFEPTPQYTSTPAVDQQKELEPSPVGDTENTPGRVNRTEQHTVSAAPDDNSYMTEDEGQFQDAL